VDVDMRFVWGTFCPDPGRFLCSGKDLDCITADFFRFYWLYLIRQIVAAVAYIILVPVSDPARVPKIFEGSVLSVKSWLNPESQVWKPLASWLFQARLSSLLGLAPLRHIAIAFLQPPPHLACNPFSSRRTFESRWHASCVVHSIIIDPL